jgi:hypothetical protein
VPFEDRALFVDAFGGGIATQPEIRRLDLEFVDGALHFGRPFGRSLGLLLGARECGRAQQHSEHSYGRSHIFSLQSGTLFVESYWEFAGRKTTCAGMRAA